MSAPGCTLTGTSTDPRRRTHRPLLRLGRRVVRPARSPSPSTPARGQTPPATSVPPARRRSRSSSRSRRRPTARRLPARSSSSTSRAGCSSASAISSTSRSSRSAARSRSRSARVPTAACGSALTASGTIQVIKLGNLASGAATFVLQTGDSLADTELWGVAAFSTNFDFLHTYGIDLQGHALLEINTTSHDEDREALARGHPRRRHHLVRLAARRAPDRPLQPGRARAGWTHALLRRSRRPARRSRSAPARSSPPRRSTASHRPTRRSRGSQLDDDGNVNEWRIKTSDGRQWWIDKTTALDGSTLYLFRGEQRTYDLAADSFSVEVEGGIKIYDVNHPSTVYAQLGGGVPHADHPGAPRVLRHRRGHDRRRRRRARDRPLHRRHPGRPRREQPECDPRCRRPARLRAEREHPEPERSVRLRAGARTSPAPTARRSSPSPAASR